MGKKKQTIGYHYLMTLVFGLGRGPFNEVREISVGGKTAWTGHMCSDDPGVINNPNLFGGEEKEGGIQGGFFLHMGKPDQVLPGASHFSTATGKGVGKSFAGILMFIMSGPVRIAKMRNLRDILPGRVSQLRGIVTFHFNGLISSMNPYPKEWSFRVRRTTAGWDNDTPWYPAKATIWMNQGRIGAMNPAHIVYQLLTDPDWGAGEDPEEINEESFIYSANLFCTESFGLCLKWERAKDTDVDGYIKSVLDHVGASLFQDRETGHYTLKPIRGDYVVANLPLFTPDSGLIEITEDDSEAVSDAINEIVVTGKNPLDLGNPIQVRQQNIAGIQAAGGKITNTVAYDGVPTAELLLRIAQRDLKASSLGLKRFTLKLDRRAWRMYPGMAFRVSDPKRGISEIVLRLGTIEDRSDMQNGYFEAKAIEDVFAMPTTSFLNPVDSEWVGPSLIALPPLEQRLVEASYRDVYVQSGQAQIEAMTSTDAVIGQLAAAADVSNREYELWSRVPPADYVRGAVGFFTDYGLLDGPLAWYADTIKLTGLTSGFIPTEQVGKCLLIGDEMVGVVSYDDILEEFTVSRGTVDTLPQEHADGARVWTLDDDLTGDNVLYQAGQTVNTKVLSRTSSDVQFLDDVTENEIDLVGRQALPYPPANMKADGVLVYSLDGTGPHEEPMFTWAERDRTLQDDALVDHTEATIGPEPGVTYTFRIYGWVSGTLVGTYTGITGDTWTYDSTMQAADSAPSIVRIEIEAVRDGLASYQKYDFLITLNSGYGLGYGFNYGGI